LGFFQNLIERRFFIVISKKEEIFCFIIDCVMSTVFLVLFIFCIYCLVIVLQNNHPEKAWLIVIGIFVMVFCFTCGLYYTIRHGIELKKGITLPPTKADTTDSLPEFIFALIFIFIVKISKFFKKNKKI
jgi:hypothetical protein